MQRSTCLVLLIGLLACSAEPRDSTDGGEIPDAGGTPDAGEVPDAGDVPDAGEDAPDAGEETPDAGGEVCVPNCSPHHCLQTCAVTVLATPGETATGLALHDGHLYWLKDGRIERVALQGGDVQSVRDASTPRSTRTRGLVIADGWALWGSDSSEADGVGLYSHRLGTSEVRELAFTASSNMWWPPSLVVGNETIGWGSNGTESDLVARSLSTGAVRVVEEDPTYSGNLGTADATTYFYTTMYLPIALRSVPLAGGTSQQVTPLGDGAAHELLVDDTHVYFLWTSLANEGGTFPEQVMRVAKAGGTPEPVSAHFYGRTLHEPWEVPFALVGSDVYVSVYGLSSIGQTFAIRRVPKRGVGDGSPATSILVGEHRLRGSLVVDGDSVYSLTEAGALIRTHR